jgi:hypothetical protein
MEDTYPERRDDASGQHDWTGGDACGDEEFTCGSRRLRADTDSSGHGASSITRLVGPVTLTPRQTPDLW